MLPLFIGHFSLHMKGVDKIMETLDTIGTTLSVLAALKEHQLQVSINILLFA
jgi:hypothetical protein